MNKCTESDIQEMLPDLLHGTLAADARGRVEGHLASCEQCREDLEVLRTVKGAAVFAPEIDVDRVVRQIPPYRTIVPGIERPARTRVVSWLVAASLAIVVLGGGSLLLTQYEVMPAPTAVVTTQTPVQTPTQSSPAPSGTSAPITPPTTVVASAPHTHALALAANVDDLSDGNLVQLMDEMSRFDALPASEPDPVISVDTSYNLEQDLR